MEANLITRRPEFMLSFLLAGGEKTKITTLDDSFLIQNIHRWLIEIWNG
jgi:hypothetical protein